MVVQQIKLLKLHNFFKWSNFNSNIVVKFEKILGFDCKNTDKEFTNFNEAKAYCSENEECNWIQNKNSNKDTFKICSKDGYLKERKTVSVYAKLENYGKYSTSIDIVFWGVK